MAQAAAVNPAQVSGAASGSEKARGWGPSHIDALVRADFAT